MSEHSPIVVADAGPLIHLDELNCLELLMDFTEVLIPRQVWQEVAKHRPLALSTPRTNFSSVDVAVNLSSAFQSMVQAFSLDLGEQAALSLMQSHPLAILLTDDTAARLAAQTYQYQVHGTIGVLLRAIRRHQLTHTEVVSLLRALPQRSTLHIRPRFLQQIIDQVEANG